MVRVMSKKRVINRRSLFQRKGIDGMLSSEFVTCEVLISKMAPEDAFAVGRAFAKITGASHSARGSTRLGSARASRAGDDALVIAHFFFPRGCGPLVPCQSWFRRGAETSTRRRV